MRAISLDTEATGLDLYHYNDEGIPAVQPYLVTTCDTKSNNKWWQWEVDPLTRLPKIQESDKEEIQNEIDEADVIVMHNSMYDVKCLRNCDIIVPWQKVHDTMYMTHLLNSGGFKSLDHLAVTELGIDISKFEDAIEKVSKKARNWARSRHKDFLLASSKLVDIMPSAKETVWKFDMWLHDYLIQHDDEYRAEYSQTFLESTPPLTDYANADSFITINLWKNWYDIIFDGGDYEKIYKMRLKLLPIIDEMQEHGLTVNYDNLNVLEEELENEWEGFGAEMIELASKYDYDLQLPDGAINNSIREFAFDILELPVVATTETGNPSLSSKDAIPKYKEELEPDTDQAKFIELYSARTKASTKKGYVRSYHRFEQPVAGHETTHGRLHPNLKPCGTKTLRWASSYPNMQQLEKDLRFGFGPLPGRVWWSIDYANLELRIPAYESQEPAMLELFENPDAAPHFGSYHLLIFDILHPEKFAEHGTEVKKLYKKDWYQWTKNGNFADMYGAVDTTNIATGKLGTADKAYHVPGAQRIISEKLVEKAALNDKWVDFAQDNGYVHTVPDKSMGMIEGYPLQVETTRWGKVKPTIPLNYHVQGTAGWIIWRAMIDTWTFLKSKPTWDIKLIGQVHDELVFDAPDIGKRKGLTRMNRVRSIMERVGEGVSVPLVAEIDYHPNNYKIAA